MEGVVDFVIAKWIEILGLLIAGLTFWFYLLDRKKKRNKELKEYLKSIQPYFKSGTSGSTANGSEWTLNFVNKGETAKNVELQDPIGDSQK